jgi:ABC-type uncharacterized transport system permease subunit
MTEAGIKKLKSAKDIERDFRILRMLLGVGISLGIAFMIIFLISHSPLEALRSFVFGPVKTLRRMGNILEATTPLLLTGVGVCLIFSANQTNMAVEGGFLLGALGATIGATLFHLPPIVHPAFCLALGGLCGAFACFVPAILFIKFDAKPVVSSLMMNFICQYLALGLINQVLRDPAAGFPASFTFAQTARLAKLLKGTNIHSGIFIGLAVAALGYLYLYRSRKGYEIRIVGNNVNFAEYSGMPVNRIIMNAQLLGGFVAGMGGAVEVLGMYTRFQYQGLTGHGFDGILVGIIAGYNPRLVPLAALFLGYIRVGADVMSRTNDIPIELVSIVQAVIIMLVVAERFLYKAKHKRLVEVAQRELALEGAVAHE